jgi:hypothetical protein
MHEQDGISNRWENGVFDKWYWGMKIQPGNQNWICSLHHELG